MNIKILVATHKNFYMPQNEEYLPIKLDREYNKDLEFIADNTGNNIAYKNIYYSEVSAWYWAWKNLDCDYIGTCQYRRYFSNNESIKEIEVYKNFNDIEKYILKKEDCKKIFENYNIILPKKDFINRTVYEQYRVSHKIQDLNECYNIIRKVHPTYIHSFEKVMNEYSFYSCNMMLTHKDIFNGYMDWLFKILFELEKQRNLNEYIGYQTRVFGYLSERLFNVWIDKNKNNLAIKELNRLFVKEIGLTKYYRHKIKKWFLK